MEIILFIVIYLINFYDIISKNNNNNNDDNNVSYMSRLSRSNTVDNFSID